VKRFVALMMFAVFVALGHSSDPRELLYKVKEELAAPGEPKIQKMISQLQQANDLWTKSSSEDPVYAESLDLLVLLLRRKLGNHRLGQWQTEAAPLAHGALEIRESHSDTSPDDLALALELVADTYPTGREGGGASFWRRASAIRADNIAAIQPREAEAENASIERVGGQVTQPQLISKVEASYTDLARLGGIQCTSGLSFVVNANGVPRRFGLRRGCGYGLDENAVQAARQWRFRPATKDGRPVNVVANIQVSFRLTNASAKR
jgi:TonB family protein